MKNRRKITVVIIAFPLIQKGQLSDFFERMCIVLVSHSQVHFPGKLN